ncbi:MAG: hypothetical protein SGCHY_003555 [Lobulomycetales sp.]
MSKFLLESRTAVPLPASPTSLSLYRHSGCGLRIALVPLPGPLCSVSIVLPTPSRDDKGLPHTLEHLVFCGSKRHPKRGYLDFLATRNLSQGTNAYTAEDHTSYQITTAGPQAMINVIPSFLDHVLHPTLHESVFTTEIYHLDGHGKHQGVVYNEMKARENSEADLMDLALRRMLFLGSTTYSAEAGGKTKDIKTLQNSECMEFHRQFYTPDQTTILVTGALEPEKLFQALESFPGLFDTPSEPRDDSIYAPSIVVAPPLPSVPSRVLSQRIHFPSSDEESGSYAIAWRIPSERNTASNFKTSVALEVLLRYLEGTTASPFYQKFVEIEDPIATDIESELKGFVCGALAIYFTGVPYRSGADESESEGEDGSDAESDPMDKDDEESSDSVADGYYFEKGRLHSLVMDLLNKVKNQDFEDPKTLEKMKNAIGRHRRKIYEGLEEDAHEFIGALVPLEIVAYHLAPPEYSQNTKSSNGKPDFSSWTEMFNVLEQLEAEPLSFWKNLLSTYMCEPVAVEVLCVPDRSLADELAKQEMKEVADRVELFGKSGLATLSERLEKAIKDNEVNLPQKVLDEMPPVPDASAVPNLLQEIRRFEITGSGAPVPFPNAEVVFTETALVDVRFFFQLTGLAPHLRPYLVIFQELLFESNLVGDDGSIVPYQEVVEETSNLLISNEAAVGLGNTVFSASWLTELFSIAGVSEFSSWKAMISHLFKILSRTVFTEDRVLTVAKNLFVDLVESKRSGGKMLSAVATRICNQIPEKDARLKSHDDDISIFIQEDLLKDIAAFPERTVEYLNQIQRHFMCTVPEVSGFIHMGFPLAAMENLDQIKVHITTAWEKEWISSRQRKNWSAPAPSSIGKTVSPWPFPRVPYSPRHIDSKIGANCIVPIPGMQCSHMTQHVACDLISSRAEDKRDLLAGTAYTPLILAAQQTFYVSYYRE